MSTEDKMTIDKRRKYLRRMKKRCIQAIRKEGEGGSWMNGNNHRIARQEPDPADERESLERKRRRRQQGG